MIECGFASSTETKDRGDKQADPVAKAAIRTLLNWTGGRKNSIGQEYIDNNGIESQKRSGELAAVERFRAILTRSLNPFVD